MIIVTGTIVARPDAIETAIEASRAHVERSRTEDGCISHEVAQDLHDAARLVFLERWRDREALRVHFSQPGSRTFIDAIGALVAEPPSMQIYTAVETAV